MSGGEVSWSVTVADSRAARVLCYLQVAFLGGAALLVTGALVGLFALTVMGGNYEALALLVLLTLVGGPFSLLYLLPLLTDPEQRPSLPEHLRAFRRLHRGGIAVAAFIGAAVMAVALGLGFGAWVLLIGGMVVAFSGGALLMTDGSLDPRAGTLQYGAHEVDLSDVTGVTRRDAAGYALLWLAYDERVGPSRLIVIPERVVDEVAPVLERTAEREDPPDPQPLALTVTLVAFGLACLAGSAGLVLLGRSVDEPAVLYWAATLAAMFGGVFLWIARAG